jgi:hypothetical protein
MGLGGYLTWTAVAREIRKKYGKNIKLLPVEQHGSFYKFLYKHKDIEIILMQIIARRIHPQKLSIELISILFNRCANYMI